MLPHAAGRCEQVCKPLQNATIRMLKILKYQQAAFHKARLPGGPVPYKVSATSMNTPSLSEYSQLMQALRRPVARVSCPSSSSVDINAHIYTRRTPIMHAREQQESTHQLPVAAEPSQPRGSVAALYGKAAPAYSCTAPAAAMHVLSLCRLGTTCMHALPSLAVEGRPMHGLWVPRSTLWIYNNQQKLWIHTRSHNRLSSGQGIVSKFVHKHRSSGNMSNILEGSGRLHTLLQGRATATRRR